MAEYTEGEWKVIYRGENFYPYAIDSPDKEIAQIHLLAAKEDLASAEEK